MEKTLDVRELSPKERHAKIFETFRDIGPGSAFVLINDHEPKPLLYQFQAEHDGEFDWWPLEEGPMAWRVEIGKRKTPDPGRSVTEYMQTDHGRLDKIYGRFQEAVRDNRWEDASRDFKEFSLGLRRHIRIEEEILFPVFEEKTGMRDSGPTAVMRMEHADIKGLLDRITVAAGAENAREAKEAAYHLTNILADHNMKEEHILYPESDAFLSDSERVQVVKKGQAL
ncbi:MAG: DUF2249 domain-containing protein [Deltaproteobacteria bacterium]|nr:DUF2249 domain-containing protein [Deltaproteobacteria bacterium]